MKQLAFASTTNIIPSTPEEVSVSAPFAFKDDFLTRREYVKSLDGKVRSKETFAKYPQYKNSEACMSEMAKILKKEKNKMIENAKYTWHRLLENNELVDEQNQNLIKILHTVIKNECKNGEENYIVQVAQSGQYVEGRKGKKQLFILCPGSLIFQ